MDPLIHITTLSLLILVYATFRQMAGVAIVACQNEYAAAPILYLRIHAIRLSHRASRFKI